MIPKDELSFFKRYLKDKGLYAVFVRDYKASLPYGKENFSEYVKIHTKGWTKLIIMDCILWTVSEYRHWNLVYSQYETIYKNEYNEKDNQ